MFFAPSIIIFNIILCLFSTYKSDHPYSQQYILMIILLIIWIKNPLNRMFYRDCQN
jgi:hypothetical protein